MELETTNQRSRLASAQAAFAALFSSDAPSSFSIIAAHDKPIESDGVVVKSFFGHFPTIDDHERRLYAVMPVEAVEQYRRFLEVCCTSAAALVSLHILDDACEAVPVEAFLHLLLMHAGVPGHGGIKVPDYDAPDYFHLCLPRPIESACDLMSNMRIREATRGAMGRPVKLVEAAPLAGRRSDAIARSLAAAGCHVEIIKRAFYAEHDDLMKLEPKYRKYHEKNLAG